VWRWCHRYRLWNEHGRARTRCVSSKLRQEAMTVPTIPRKSWTTEADNGKLNQSSNVTFACRRRDALRSPQEAIGPAAIALTTTYCASAHQFSSQLHARTRAGLGKSNSLVYCISHFLTDGQTDPSRCDKHMELLLRTPSSGKGSCNPHHSGIV
jgi:hypothetical protein